MQQNNLEFILSTNQAIYNGMEQIQDQGYICFMTATNFLGKTKNPGFIFEYGYKQNELISLSIEEMTLPINWLEVNY